MTSLSTRRDQILVAESLQKQLQSLDFRTKLVPVQGRVLLFSSQGWHVQITQRLEYVMVLDHERYSEPTNSLSDLFSYIQNTNP
jgi:hypothetical protein